VNPPLSFTSVALVGMAVSVWGAWLSKREGARNAMQWVGVALMAGLLACALAAGVSVVATIATGQAPSIWFLRCEVAANALLVAGLGVTAALALEQAVRGRRARRV
jgi:hypothetical protein